MNATSSRRPIITLRRANGTFDTADAGRHGVEFVSQFLDLLSQPFQRPERQEKAAGNNPHEPIMQAGGEIFHGISSVFENGQRIPVAVDLRVGISSVADSAESAA